MCPPLRSRVSGADFGHLPFLGLHRAGNRREIPAGARELPRRASCRVCPEGCRRPLGTGCRSRCWSGGRLRRSTCQCEVRGRQLCFLLDMRTLSGSWQPQVQSVTCLSVDLETRGGGAAPGRLDPAGLETPRPGLLPGRGPVTGVPIGEFVERSWGGAFPRCRLTKPSAFPHTLRRGATDTRRLGHAQQCWCPSQMCATPRALGLCDKGRAHGESTHPPRGDELCQTQSYPLELCAPPREAQPLS